MNGYQWVVNFKDYHKERMDRPSANACRKYTDGFKFNMIRRKPMFEDELKDLEKVYKSTLADRQEGIDYLLSDLVDTMKHFVKAYENQEEIREKLDVLLAKTGRSVQEKPCGDSNE